MNTREIIENSPLYEKIKDHFKFDEVLAPYTSFKIGGKAEVLYMPFSTDELKTMLDIFIKEKVEISILGNASNLLISDRGIKGVVIRLAHSKNVSVIKEEDNVVFVAVGADVLLETLLQFCIKEELSGIEDFGGLPASIGGAVFMNAKCFNVSMSDVLFSVDVLRITEKGTMLDEYKMNLNDWGYKTSPFQKDAVGIKMFAGREIILSCVLKLKKGKRDEIKKRIEERYKERVEKKQFDFPSAGSVFKNDYTIGIPTGKLVSEAGLLGLQYGGAQIALWHGNFIINKGEARASDVLNLMIQVRKKIQEKCGIVLEPEIIYCE